MYQISIAATGNTEETQEKNYEDADTALRAGKRLLSNQAGGTVTVYEVGGDPANPVRYAKKTSLNWESIEV